MNEAKAAELRHELEMERKRKEARREDLHRYHLINRPPSIGTHPAGEKARETVYPSEHADEISRPSFGWVGYARPLTFQQMWEYELLPADENERERYWAWRDAEGK